MRMPAELSMPVQRALRTMISGLMLVQCFTVYVYLATYIVLLYPVFLVPVFIFISCLRLRTQRVKTLRLPCLSVRSSVTRLYLIVEIFTNDVLLLPL